ncbi:GNAT family N-acetyltransferase [Cohnella silvisoli]|uniref:GNAT family N-acetyltransferase n=1 Tax=Cohnella silvisoli TaxID=2873699 RepID=A0ABV1L263_9BACL|nr:GNAT family N-acetyltransferase [Cohnella silvisoli]MCD9025475.1 GNAT family N-acetyltransferase [Cohnella silvisoli]
MLSHRTLSNADLETICSFPQNPEELFYMGPKFHYPLTPDQIVRVLENRFSPTVIINTSTMESIAYANLYDIDDKESICWLGNVIVSPEYRNKGIAEFLINTMTHKAKNEYGISKMKLFCHNTNTRGLIFYCKYGFKPCGNKIIISQENKKIVAIEMEKEL